MEGKLDVKFNVDVIDKKLKVEIKLLFYEEFLW